MVTSYSNETRSVKNSVITEIAHIYDWAERNNLRLNRAKTKEITGKRGHAAQGPPPCEDTQGMSSLTALGVVINDKLTVAC